MLTTTIISQNQNNSKISSMLLNKPNTVTKISLNFYSPIAKNYKVTSWPYLDRVSEVCDDMKRSKDNHAIVGYYPSG